MHSPLTADGYLARNPVLLGALRLIDALPWPHPTAPTAMDRPPRRLLLANWAHLGDCVIATATVDLVRQLLPKTEIGFLAGSWAANILANDPRLSWLHVVDHWKISRANHPPHVKFVHYRRMRHQAIQEIRTIGYDAAIDLYYLFPPAGPLFHAAGIPRRIGYASGGFRRYLTHAHPWLLTDQSVAIYQSALLADIGIAPLQLQNKFDSLRPRLNTAEAPSPLKDHAYVVVHMGAGASVKEWTDHRWREVVKKLLSDGHQVILTGYGEGEARRCREVAEGLTGVVNLCNTLDWNGLVHTIARARLLIGVDSVAGHVAAATNTPVLTLWCGINNPAHWRPLSPYSRILHTAPPCLPCYYRPSSCPGLVCLNGISADMVMDAARELLMAIPSSRHSSSIGIERISSNADKFYTRNP